MIPRRFFAEWKISTLLDSSVFGGGCSPYAETKARVKKNTGSEKKLRKSAAEQKFVKQMSSCLKPILIESSLLWIRKFILFNQLDDKNLE